MSELEFEENNNDFYLKTKRHLGQRNQGSFVSLLLKTGIVKTEDQANIFLNALVAVVLLLSIVLWGHQSSSSQPEVFYLDDNGNRYEAEEYVELLQLGHDPLAKPAEE